MNGAIKQMTVPDLKTVYSPDIHLTYFNTAKSLGPTHLSTHWIRSMSSSSQLSFVFG